VCSLQVQNGKPQRLCHSGHASWKPPLWTWRVINGNFVMIHRPGRRDEPPRTRCRNRPSANRRLGRVNDEPRLPVGAKKFQEAAPSRLEWRRRRKRGDTSGRRCRDGSGRANITITKVLPTQFFFFVAPGLSLTRRFVFVYCRSTAGDMGSVTSPAEAGTSQPLSPMFPRFRVSFFVSRGRKPMLTDRALRQLRELPTSPAMSFFPSNPR
jgi:hypothetical protein